jgi:RNA polymerase sigma factor (sigma-70 family)
MEARRRALLQNVLEEVPAPRLKASERIVTGKNTTRERFEQVFLANYARVVSVLCRIVGDHARAEDLANEVFLKLYRQPMPTDAVDNVSGWLYRTATNLGIDALRASARRYRYEEAAARAQIKESVAESALDHSLRLETQERVRSVLAELKPVQAQLLLLRASGHSYKELAETLDLEIGTIGTRLIRAEAAFEERYIQLYGREEKL